MGKRLLIVDDALFMRMVIGDVAREAGWQVVGEASDGQEAVDLYRRLRPELVTLDLVMPRKGGMEALSEIREMDPNACVVVVSALDQKEHLVNAIRQGASDFIVKPFERERIIGVFEKVEQGT